MQNHGMSYFSLKKNLSPIQIAVELKDYALCKKLLDLGAPIHHENISVDNSALAMAIGSGQEDIAILLIDHGFPLNLLSEYGFNFLHTAAMYGRTKVCKALLEKGMDVDSSYKICESGDLSKYHLVSSLFLAIIEKQWETAKYLIKGPFKANVNQVTDYRQDTLLHFFTYKRDIAACNFLAHNGANLNLLNCDQESPLLIATLNNDISFVQSFLELGANPNLLDSKGITCLNYAKSQSICEILLKFKADPNIKEEESGNTPLHIAVLNQRDEQLINCLLNKGADAWALNNVGNTPRTLIFSVDKIARKSYELLKEKDRGLAESRIMFSLMGGRFSLKGPLFEGIINSSFCFNELARTFSLYLESLSSPVEQSLKEIPPLFAEAASQKGNIDYFLQRISDKKLTVIPLEWEEHAISLVIFDKFICQNNSGAMCEDRPGIIISEIQDMSNIHVALAQLMKANYDGTKCPVGMSRKEVIEKIKAEKINCFNNIMKSTLNLKELYYLPVTQNSGNCGSKSAKMAFRSAMILLRLQKDPERKIQDIVAQINPINAEWVKFDAFNALPLFKNCIKLPYFHKFYDVDQVWKDVFRWFERSKKFTIDELKVHFHFKDELSDKGS
jgi:ankyrin repeat protein